MISELLVLLALLGVLLLPLAVLTAAARRGQRPRQQQRFRRVAP